MRWDIGVGYMYTVQMYTIANSLYDSPVLMVLIKTIDAVAAASKLLGVPNCTIYRMQFPQMWTNCYEVLNR